MKRNVILSTVAATVVTGVLMMSGCNSSSPEAVAQSYEGNGTVEVVPATDGTTSSVAIVQAETPAGNPVEVRVAVNKVSDCVDASNQPAPCVDVCTPANPCAVTVTASCPSELNYANNTDTIGAWHAYNNTADANVQAVKDDNTLVPTFSGVATVNQTGGIGSCGFDFSTFIVCAVNKEGVHYWNTSSNSAGYVLVLVEFADGTSEWQKIDITRKFNGVEYDQPFIELLDVEGKVPAKITVFSILNAGAPATGSGSTGVTGGAGD